MPKKTTPPPPSFRSPRTKPEPKKQGRVAQVRESYRLTKQQDPHIGWILLGCFLGTAVVLFLVCWLALSAPAFGVLFGILAGLLVVMIVFGRRAQSAAMKSIEGKPGAAAAALGMLRRGWKIEPAIAVTRQQDVVSRVVGPPGIVLLGEGNVNRLRPLLTSERRKHERVASDTQVHEVLVGDYEGEVPLRKLAKYLRKLPRSQKPAEMTDVLARLRALDASRQALPIPKGPVPTSMKGSRTQMRGR